jgi:uncharacterized membrane protein
VFGLALVLALLVLIIILPLTTSLRVLRLTREVEELREHVAQLQKQLSVTGAPPPSSEPEQATQISQTVEAMPQSPTAATPLDAQPAHDLEGRIGGRGLLYTGVLILLFGVSFFLKYAFDNEWIDETGRVLLGGLAGSLLIVAGIRLTARDLLPFGQALIGAGLAVLYLVIYTALSFYALIGNTTAFALLIFVSIAAAVLADRQRSEALAFIAVGGGFVTPFLVGFRADTQLALFSYDALLVAGTLLLSRRHQWHALNALSYIFTFVTVVAWMSLHYRERLWLRTLLFLTLYCVMFVQVVRASRDAHTAVARLVTALLATAPLFYHLTAVVLTARHPPAIHIYLIAFTAVGLVVTAEPHRPGLRLLLLLGSYIPLVARLTLPVGISWLVANTITIVAVAALHLLAPLDRAFRQEQRLQSTELVTLHVAALGLYGLLYQALGSAYPDWRGALGAILAVAAIVLWQRLRRKDSTASLAACALAFTLSAIAVAIQFDGPAAVAAWAAEGAAATWIGLRVASAIVQFGGLTLWGLAIIRLLDGYFDTPTHFVPVFNVRSATTGFVVMVSYLLAWMFARHRNAGAHFGRVRAVLHLIASILTAAWITAEVGSYWDLRYGRPQAHLYEQLYLSLGWGLYGALLIVVGMRRAYAPDRYIGITVLAVTVLKVFFSDLWQLGGIYRVVGFIVVGMLLLGVSFLYQQRRAPRIPTTSD